jgi:EpsI family protein
MNPKAFYSVVFILLLAVAGSSLADRRPPQSLARPLADIPRELAGWQTIEETTLSERQLEILRPTTYVSRILRKDGRTAGVLTLYFAAQEQGAAIHSPKTCLPQDGWVVRRSSTVHVHAGGNTVPVNHYSLEKDGKEIVVLYWYQTPRRTYANEYAGKFYMAIDTMLRGETAGSIVRITLPADEKALEDGLTIASAVMPELGHCLRR